MKNDYLVISSSLNPESNSRILAQQAYEILNKKGKAEFVDLRDFDLPLCDGDSAYSHPSVSVLADKIKQAHCILLGMPVYNYAASAAAKNLIELTGQAWEEKIVGFICAAGGKFSYMSVMGLANSLMLDFRCLIIPRFVYADSSAFSESQIADDNVVARIGELAENAHRLISLTKVMA